MSRTLLLISIGPVQDFIASARKLRDLWFGSYILSELSKTVARSLFENKAELIFPTVNDSSELDEGSELNVANKIMAIVSSPEEADRLQKLARSAWNNHITRISEKALEKINEIKKIKIMEDLYRKQISDYGEFYAAWVEIDIAGGYSLARNRVEQILSARKNVREFSAPAWNGSGIIKNSLDGVRESVIPEKATEIRGLLKNNERLDAMGCIKRFYSLYPLSKGLKRHFDDLSDIALRPWLEGISKDSSKRDLFYDFCKTVCTENTKWISERKTADDIAVNQLIISDLFFAQQSALKEALGDERDLGQALRVRRKMVKKCGEPNLYSVIMVGDGDRMGQMIDSIESVDGHKKFTETLSGFASDAGKVVREHHGSLVYSGGDDVMAYLPLHTAVSCGDKLRINFFSIMEKIKKELKLNCEIPTFSIGMAIVHHSLPLDQALDLARKAEKTAKKQGGRNALAITQSKRSGSDITVFGKWDEMDGLKGMADRIQSIVDLYNGDDEILPTRLGYQLREARVSAGDEMKFEVRDGKIIACNASAALVKRIFDHKNDGDSVKNEKLFPLLSGRKSIRKLSDELVVVNQMARAVCMASGKECL